MSKSYIIVTFTLALVAGCAALYWQLFPSYSHRYRLTVKVEAGGDVRAGSSVIETRWRAQPEGIFAVPFDRSVRGEAIFIDLGTRGNLIVTLGPDDSPTRIRKSRGADKLALRAFGLPSDRAGLAAVTSRKGPVDLPVDALPCLVTFTEPLNPQSLKALTPEEVPQVFGAGVAIISATIEITDAAIAWSIREKLPWLKTMRANELISRLDGGRHPFFYAANLIAGES